jgi:hypothetical protein
VENYCTAVHATDNNMALHIACCLPRATNTHSKYCLLLFHCNNGYMNAPQCYDVCTLQSFGQQDNKKNNVSVILSVTKN